MTDASAEAILAYLDKKPHDARYGETIGDIAQACGIKSGIVRSRVRALERGGKVESIRNLQGRLQYAIPPDRLPSGRTWREHEEEAELAAEGMDHYGHFDQ